MEQFGLGQGSEFPNVTGSVEISLLGAADGFSTIQQLEAVAVNTGGILHWGQSNWIDAGRQRHSELRTTWTAVANLEGYAEASWRYDIQEPVHGAVRPSLNLRVDAESEG